MAEKSPRPGAEEDAEEEGEEAAEAPVRAVKVKVGKDKSAFVVTPSPLGEAEEAPLPRSLPSPPSRGPASPPASPPEPSPQRAVPEATAYPKVTPGHPAASPAFYTPPSGDAACTSPAVCPSVSGVNLFANDGSFLELFRKKMEASSAGTKEEVVKEPEEKKPEPDKRKPISFVGKRRGGAKLALKTGIVAKKPKTEDEEILTHKGGAWAQYMAEVKKYKAHQCSDDDKTRPLVK